MGTISLNIFKADDEKDYNYIKTYLAEYLKVNEKRCTYREVFPIVNGKEYAVCAFYLRGCSDGEDSIWETKLTEEFGIEIDIAKKIISSYGAMLVSFDGKNYILSFGKANGKIVKVANLDFGLDMASKMLTDETIKVQSSKFFGLDKNKSIVEFSKNLFLGTIGETFDGLVGDMEEYPGRSSINNISEYIHKNAEFTTSVFLDIKDEYFQIEYLCKLIFNLDNIFYNYNQRVKIPRLKRVKKTEVELLQKLNNELNTALLNEDFEDENMIISFYKIENSKFIFSRNIVGYELLFKRYNKTFERLTLKDVVDFMKEYNIDDISKVKVRQIESDGTKNDKTTPVSDLLEYTVKIDDEKYYTLSLGVWNEYNEKFIEIIDENIEQLKKLAKVEYREEYNYNSSEITRCINENIDEFNNIIKRPYPEIKYNFWFSKCKNTILCDRASVQSIEVCDLYNEELGLIHVKMGSTKNFMECIDQSENGVKYYNSNTTRAKTRLGIGDTNIATLLLLTENRNVIESGGDISKFKSLRFKLNLLEWFEKLKKNRFEGRIIIAQK